MAVSVLIIKKKKKIYNVSCSGSISLWQWLKYAITYRHKKHWSLLEFVADTGHIISLCIPAYKTNNAQICSNTKTWRGMRGREKWSLWRRTSISSLSRMLQRYNPYPFYYTRSSHLTQDYLVFLQSSVPPHNSHTESNSANECSLIKSYTLKKQNKTNP